MDPILLFIDETYLAHGTGRIQTVVPAPRSLYDKHIFPECQKMLAQLGSTAKEFKGGNLKPGNRALYQKFLRLVRNLAAIVAEHSPLRMVITLDGSAIEAVEPFPSVFQHIELALHRVGITDQERLAKSFSRQLVWLKDHFAAIAERSFPNPLVVTFDNQYRYAEHMQRQRAIVRNGTEITSFRRLEEVLTIAANCLLQQWREPIALPPIRQITFRDSTAVFGIQAADLFSNLFFSFVLFELGHTTNDTIRFKAELCRELLPGCMSHFAQAGGLC